MAARVDAGAPLSHRMTAIAVGRVLLLLFAAVMVGVVLVCVKDGGG